MKKLLTLAFMCLLMLVLTSFRFTPHLIVGGWQAIEKYKISAIDYEANLNIQQWTFYGDEFMSHIWATKNDRLSGIL